LPIIIVVKHIKLNAQIFNGTTIEVLKNPFLSIHNKLSLHMHSISKLFAKLGDGGGARLASFGIIGQMQVMPEHFLRA
jgi:hypothetical protein